MGLRIVTWNVNGIRNPFSYEPWRSRRTFESMFDILEADIVIFQETKIQRKDLRDDMVLVPGWDCYFSFPAKEKGKFGVVIYTRQSTCAPIRAEEGVSGTLHPPNSSVPFCELPDDQQIGGYPSIAQLVDAPNAPEQLSTDFDEIDSEGRCVIVEFPAFVLFGVYAPATRDEARALFKTAFMNMLDVRIRNLIRLGKRVVLTGDLNVSREALDVANIEVDLAKSGSTIEEHFGTGTRRMFNHLVIGGWVQEPRDKGRDEQVLWDLCRGFHPDREGMYTHWETKINARPANYGSRIDFILCSPEMKEWFSDSNIQEGLHGSDHCPVFAVMKDKIVVDGKEEHSLDVMNPPGMFKDGKRLRPHTQKDSLPLSGRLLPDFTGRQSIRDMFTRKPSQTSKTPTGQIGVDVLSVPDASDRDDEDAWGTATESSAAVSFESVGFDSSQTAYRSAVGQYKRAETTSAKRKSPDKGSAARPVKKTKASTGGGASRLSPTKGQSQISGFFKPKTPKASPSESVPAFSETAADSALSSTAIHAAGPDTANSVDRDGKVAGDGQDDREDDSRWVSSLKPDERGASGDGKLPPLDMDPARELEESREGWAKLFSKPQVPLCEHGETCKLMLSKKHGPNYLRSFYMCERPLGPSGEKERGTQWRCRTFVWMK